MHQSINLSPRNEALDHSRERLEVGFTNPTLQYTLL